MCTARASKNRYETQTNICEVVHARASKYIYDHETHSVDHPEAAADAAAAASPAEAAAADAADESPCECESM